MVGSPFRQSLHENLKIPKMMVCRGCLSFQTIAVLSIQVKSQKGRYSVTRWWFHTIVSTPSLGPDSNLFDEVISDGLELPARYK